MALKADKVSSMLCSHCGAAMDVSSQDPFSTALCPACGRSQIVPMQFGSILLLEPLGAGGMGAIYRALDPMLDRYLAIKVMQTAGAADDQFVENFFREARAAAALNHPHIVQIYSCGREYGQPYIAMELLEGGTLDEMIHSSGTVDELDVLQIGISVSEGLRAAGEIGLTHGDIKPANILFDSHHKAKIADFGLARFMQQGSSAEIWGTPFYIAPEKLRKQKEDQRSDIYSLGATLFHALTGQPPFDGKTATDVAVARLDQPPPDVRDRNPGISPEVAAVIARMLKENPHERYPTYASLIADMKSVLAVLRQKRGSRPMRPKMRKSHAGAFVAAALFALIAAGIWMSQREGSGPPEGPLSGPSRPEEPAVPEMRGSKPFEGVRGTAMERILNLFAAGNVMAASESLQALYEKIPPDSPDRSWICLFQALMLWYDGNGGSGDELLDRALAGFAGSDASAGALIAAYMKGNMDEAAVEASAGEQPQWVGDFTGFVAGMNHARQGRKDEADVRWRTYLQTTNDKPAWVYVLKPLAQKFTESHARWKRLDADVTALLEARKPGEARVLLRDFKLTAGPVFAAETDQLFEKVQALEASLTEAEAARLAEQQAAAAARKKAKAEAEVAKVRKAVESGRRHYPSRDFDRALAAIEKLRPAMTTEEGWVEYQLAREKVSRLDAMHRYLQNALRTRPCRISVFGKNTRVAGATSRGVRVAIGTQADMVREWQEITAAQYVGLIRQYLDAEQKTVREKADDHLSLAVFASETDGGQLAAQLARKAVALDPAVRDLGLRLLPDLDWE